MIQRQEADRELAPSNHTESHLSQITPRTDRRNGRILALSYALLFFAAPVVYVGVVQAALCDKLGASATVANLPASAYLLGSFAPLVLSWLISDRWVRAVVVGSYTVTAVLLAVVCSLLVLPVGNSVRLVAVIGQGLIQGFSGSVANIYTFLCLGRGTTLEGRAKALKMALTVGPISAVMGSLWAQFVLGGGVPNLPYPYDFAFLYLLGVPCVGAVALLSYGYELVPFEQVQRRQLFHQYLIEGVKSFVRERPLVLLWLTYLFWYFTYGAMSNLSLYTRLALGRDPMEFSGLIMALRFSFKALAGFALGMIAMRKGVRAPLAITILLVGGATLWAWVAPGYFYLLAFGLMGAGELAGAYFPNYVVAISSATAASRNTALLNLVTPVSSLGPVLHGGIPIYLVFQPVLFLGLPRP
jgi:hypothetical protein